MTTITTDDIRIAAERLINEATLHHVESGPDRLTADILLVAPAALAGLDLTAEIERLKAALVEIIETTERVETENAVYQVNAAYRVARNALRVSSRQVESQP